MTEGPNGFFPKLPASEFIENYKKTDKFGLSLGWTTTGAQDPKDEFTEQQTNAMKEIVDKNIGNGTDYALNFPIRAVYAVKSQTLLKNFYDSVKKDHAKVTYSIFSGKLDDVAADELGKFVKLIGVENVYLIINDNLRSQLNLGSGAAELVHFGLLNLAMLIVVAIFRNGLH